MKAFISLFCPFGGGAGSFAVTLLKALSTTLYFTCCVGSHEKCKGIRGERVVHAADMRAGLLQLCLGGQRSCKPAGASAAAELLLEQHKQPRGWTDSSSLLSLPRIFFPSRSVSCALSRSISL